jgi:hypothetical protein
MKSVYRIGLAVALALVVFSGCGDSDGGGGNSGTRKIHGDGMVEVDDRLVSGFTEVTHASEGSLHIEQAQDGQEALRVQAEENLLPHIITEVQGGALQIRTENGVDLVPTEPIEFFVTVVDLERVLLSGVGAVDLSSLSVNQLSVTLSGVGDIECSNLTATELSVVHSGVGSIGCAGQVDLQTVRIEGVGDYEAPSLASRETTVTVTSTSGGSATVNVNERLSATIDGSGSVTYIDSSGGGLIVDCTPSSGCVPSP